MSVAVCCGCRPRVKVTLEDNDNDGNGDGTTGKKKKGGLFFGRTKKDKSNLLNQKSNSSHYSDYQDADESNANGEGLLDNNNDDDDSCYFFDALETPLGNDEYPVLLQEEQDEARARTKKHQLRHLKQKQKQKQKQQRSQRLLLQNVNQNGSSIRQQQQQQQQQQTKRSRTAAIQYDQKEPSERFTAIIDTDHDDLMEAIANPKGATLEGDGYPGNLTALQLDECRTFLDILASDAMDPSVAEQIYSFRDVEDPAYTICRWLRATKWNATAILERCAANQAMFDDAQIHRFYPNPSQDAMGGAPFPVFLSQYPFLPIGKGKNGCPVNYFQAGKINPEGIMCLVTSTAQLEGYFWWSFQHKMKLELRKNEHFRNPTTRTTTTRKNGSGEVVRRCEGINIIDLQGLSRAALSSDTMAVISLAGKISDFFPETLNCMLILNAPTFFSMTWGLIKKFIDPQTASRIQVCSGKEQGMKLLQSVIDVDQIPSDYGGSNISISDAFRNEANDPLLLRQEVELFYVKRKAKTKYEWTIQKGEHIDLKCYTRSSSGVTVTIRLNGDHFKTIDNVQCGGGGGGGGDGSTPDDGLPKAVCHTLCTKLMLEGRSAPANSTILVELRDNDNADKKHNKESRGYFLVVGDIKRSEA